MAKYCVEPLISLNCAEVLKSMQNDGLALDDILEFILTWLHTARKGACNSICLPFVNDTAFDGFTQFAIEYIRTSALWECFLAQLEREPEDNFATILLYIASDMPPGPEKDRCDEILCRLTQDERLSTITRNTLSLYTSSLPEVMPKHQWEPFEITVTHGYSAQARQMERAETFGHRHILANPEPCTLMPYKPVTSVNAILQRADQTTCIFNDRDLQEKEIMLQRHDKRFAISDAEFVSKAAKGIAVALFIYQARSGRYRFGFSITKGSRSMLTYTYTSQFGSWIYPGWGCDKLFMGRDSNPLGKYPEEWILDPQRGKILKKADLQDIISQLEHGYNDWARIILRLEELTFGRCRPLEWPSFDIGSPSSCPKEYTPVDAYDFARGSVRTEVYYKTSDMEQLPAYKR